MALEDFHASDRCAARRDPSPGPRPCRPTACPSRRPGWARRVRPRGRRARRPLPRLFRRSRRLSRQTGLLPLRLPRSFTSTRRGSKRTLRQHRAGAASSGPSSSWGRSSGVLSAGSGSDPTSPSARARRSPDAYGGLREHRPRPSSRLRLACSRRRQRPDRLHRPSGPRAARLRRRASCRSGISQSHVRGRPQPGAPASACLRPRRLLARTSRSPLRCRRGRGSSSHLYVARTTAEHGPLWRVWRNMQSFG
jgi:hypothetical protein